MPTSPLENRSYMEFVEFIMSRPSHAEITAFRFTAATQAHVSSLQDARKRGTITDDESTELAEYLHLERLLTMLKMRALEKLHNTTTIE
jgi:hypothetical protein